MECHPEYFLMYWTAFKTAKMDTTQNYKTKTDARSNQIFHWLTENAGQDTKTVISVIIFVTENAGQDKV